MSEPTHEVNDDEDRAPGGEATISTTVRRASRWQKVVGIVGLVVVLLVTVKMVRAVTGDVGDHGPGGSEPPADVTDHGDQAPPGGEHDPSDWDH